MSALLFSTFAVTTFTDIKWFRVFNWVVYPAIGVALCNTFYFISVILCAGLMGFLLYNKHLNWCGGDAKLFMLIAAFEGYLFIPALILTVILVRAYRFANNYRLGLPITPFAFMALILTMLTRVALKAIVAG